MKYLRIFLISISAIMIILKLTGEVNWSWWVILSPIWVAALICVIIFTWAFILIYRSGSDPYDTFPDNIKHF